MQICNRVRILNIPSPVPQPCCGEPSGEGSTGTFISIHTKSPWCIFQAILMNTRVGFQVVSYAYLRSGGVPTRQHTDGKAGCNNSAFRPFSFAPSRERARCPLRGKRRSSLSASAQWRSPSLPRRMSTRSGPVTLVSSARTRAAMDPTTLEIAMHCLPPWPPACRVLRLTSLSVSPSASNIRSLARLDLSRMS